MKRFVSLLLVCLMVFGFALSVSAKPDQEWLHESGAFVKVRQMAPDHVTFSFGWSNANTYPSAPTEYWIGVYNVTQSHYHWGGGYIPVQSPPNPMQRSVTVKGLNPEDQFKIVFFVNGDGFSADLHNPFNDYDGGGCYLDKP